MVDGRCFRLWLCVRPKSSVPCERDELMTLVKGLQRQIAQFKGRTPSWRRPTNG